MRIFYLGGYFSAEHSLWHSFKKGGCDIVFYVCNDNKYYHNTFKEHHLNFENKGQVVFIGQDSLKAHLRIHNPDLVIHRHYRGKPMMFDNSKLLCRKLRIPWIKYEQETNFNDNVQSYINSDQDFLLYAHNTAEYLARVPAKSAFYPYGVSPFETILNIKKDRDIGCIGRYQWNTSSHRENSLQFFKEALNGRKLHAYGDNWPKLPFVIAHPKYNLEEATEIINRHKIILNIESISTLEGAYSFKMVQAMGCGAVVITVYKKCLETLFGPSGQNLVMINTITEASEWIEKLLKNKTLRDEISQRCHNFMHTRFDWHNRFKQIKIKSNGIKFKITLSMDPNDDLGTATLNHPTECPAPVGVSNPKPQVPEPVETPNAQRPTPNAQRQTPNPNRQSPARTERVRSGGSIVNHQLDLVYILGSGSQWNNNELRYSLRSVQKNLQNFRNIYIVGSNPGFLNRQSSIVNRQSPARTERVRSGGSIIFIPYPDELGPQNADGNITRKIIRACKEKDLSDTFIKMNDDYIILSPLDAAHIYPMHKGEIPVKTKPLNSNPWRKRLYRTAEVLIEKHLPFLHYDYHAPFPINKHDFAEVVSQFNYEYHIGYTTRSMYGNVVYPDAIQLSWEKVKIFTPKTVAQINQLTQSHPLPASPLVKGGQGDLISNSPLVKGGQGDLTANCHHQPPLFLAYNDHGLNNSLKFWLATQFPEPSAFETGDIDDPMATLAKWHISGQNYQLGVEAFKHMYKNRNLLKIFTLAQNETLEKKINFKLQLKLNDL